MSRTIATECLRVAWRIGTLQANAIRSDFVGANGFRQRASLPARLGIKSSSRTAPGMNEKFIRTASSPSQSPKAAIGSDCFDA